MSRVPTPSSWRLVDGAEATIQQTRRNALVCALGLASNAALTSHMAWAPGHTTVARSASRTSALTGCQPVPVWKSKICGAFVLIQCVVLHAIDATPARWPPRCVAYTSADEATLLPAPEGVFQ
jgi:hypothetical protein